MYDELLARETHLRVEVERLSTENTKVCMVWGRVESLALLTDWRLGCHVGTALFDRGMRDECFQTKCAAIANELCHRSR